jgi:tetratricopeptide (TPR) repeat protein
VTASAAAPNPELDDEEGAVDVEHPWPGLASYLEFQQQYFFGRGDEIDALYRRVARRPLTVLFGQSGLGKTSLLNAGLFPILRKEGMLPVWIRLDYAETAPALDVQVREVLGKAVREAGGTLPGDPDTPVTLWETFHDPERAPRDDTGAPIIVVLVMDQFEEMFTKGYGTEAARARAAAFVSALAAVVERWVPPEVEARLASDPALAARLDYDSDSARVLLSLREDYLPHLEEFRSALPSMGSGGMRLTRMSEEQGLEAVIGPGSIGSGDALVTADVAIQIMRFVSRTRRSESPAVSATPVAQDHGGPADTQVDPALLNLFCRELNRRRLASGLPRITAELFAGSSDDILCDFYNRALAGQPAAVRAFVEDELVTDSGVRENMAVERAVQKLARAGAPEGVLDKLVTRRLLNYEERLGTRRVELTHDVLVPVIVRSRNERRQREQVEEARRREAEVGRVLRERTRKTRVYIGGLLGIVAVLSVALGGAVIEWRKARAGDAAIRKESELTGVFFRTMGNVMRYAADSNISGRAVERYFLKHSMDYLDSLHRVDASSLRVMTTMAQFDVLMAALDQAYRSADTAKADAAKADSLRELARQHAVDAITTAKTVIRLKPDPATRQTAYGLVAWAAETQRSFGDTAAAISTLSSADSLADVAQRVWARTKRAPSDTIVRRAPLFVVILYDELGQWCLVAKRWTQADSAFAHASTAERGFGRQRDQADSQVAVRLALIRFAIQRARARRFAGDSSDLSYHNSRDSVRALLRQLPPPFKDTAASGGHTRADSEATNLSAIYDHVADDFRAAGDSAGGLDVFEHEFTIDSTLVSRYHDSSTFINVSYTAKRLLPVYYSVGDHLLTTGDTAGGLKVVDRAFAVASTVAPRYHDRTTLATLAYLANKRTQLRLATHQNAIAATDYGDLVAVRKRMIGLPDHKSQDTANVASALGGEAYALLLAHRPADAVAASQEALTFDPTQLFIRTNLAHGLLLTGHYDDAMRIYRTYWTRRLGQQTFGQAVLQDFRDLATAGVTDPVLGQAADSLRREFPRT